MFGREEADGAVMAEYFRFNNGTKSSIEGNAALRCAGACSFEPSTAPWEPTSVHTVTVNGVERADVIKTNKMTGDHPVGRYGTHQGRGEAQARPQTFGQRHRRNGDGD